MTWFDSLRALTGDQSDPIEEMKNYANEQQRQNRAAIGMDANGNLLPAGAAPGAPQPLSPGQQATVEAHAASTLPPGQEPNATKTPQSLGATIMDLARYEQREQGFNQGMGGAFASISQPRNRDWVKGIFNVNPIDAAKYGQTMMNVGSQQQGQDRANAIGQMINDPTQGPLIAQKLHMDWTALKTLVASDPGGAGKIAALLGTPTDAIRNLTQLGQMGGAAASPELKDITSGVVSSIAGPEYASMDSAQAAWRAKHLGQPDTAMPWPTNDLAGFKQWQANEAQKEATRGKAAENLVPIQEKSEELRRNLEQLREMPGLQTILDSSIKREAARTALHDQAGWDAVVARNIFSEPEKAALAIMKKVGGGQYSEALHSLVGTGTRVTQQEVGPLSSSIGLINEPNMDYKTFVRQAINPLITRTKRIVAAAYGSTGNLSGMDSEYAPWLHSVFKKNGELYKEGSGADELPNAQPVPADVLAGGKAQILKDPADKEDLLDHWQQQGLDVSQLRKTDPSKW